MDITSIEVRTSVFDHVVTVLGVTQNPLSQRFHNWVFLSSQRERDRETERDRHTDTQTDTQTDTDRHTDRQTQTDRQTERERQRERERERTKGRRLFAVMQHEQSISDVNQAFSANE